MREWMICALIQPHILALGLIVEAGNLRVRMVR
jgi:hypothetical protein